MAVTIFHRVINRVRIINNNGKPKEPEKKMVRVRGDIKAKRHVLTESKDYD